MKNRIIVLFLCAAMLICTLPVAALAASLARLDLRANTMTGNIGYAEGIENINVHTAEADGYHFLLGASIIKFGEVWICSYGQSKEIENDNTSRFACKYSYDNCKTWSEEVVIADTAGGYSRGHGVLYDDGETLWAFCPKATFDGTAVFENIEFAMEAYTLDTDTMIWTFKGVVMEADFWPLCEPIKLANGDVLIAGLECESGNDKAAVAIARGGDLSSFERVIVPSKISMWGESTVIDYGDRLVLFARTNKGYVGVSQSADYGRSWTSLELTDMAATASKMYAGTLSSGSRYLIYNYGGTREKLAITVGNTDGSYGFNNIYLIKDGYEKNSLFGFSKQWAYPYAVEEDGYLYVVYSENKEDCELSIIPVSSLEYKELSYVDSYESGFNSRPVPNYPDHETIIELVDTDEAAWWSGEGTDGTDNVQYTKIDGVPVVARLQSASPNNQVLRRTFSVDYETEDYDRLAFIITFWSAIDFTDTPSNSNRLFWGNCTSASGENLKFSTDYTINTRIDYKGSANTLWKDINAGWNTWVISFGSLAFKEDIDDLNTFFSVFLRDSSVADGSILYAISSLKIVRLSELTSTPSLRINHETNEWEISYNDGRSWESLGVKATAEKGDDGADGETPYIGDNGNWWIGDDDTGIKAQGVDGSSGKDGNNGKDAQSSLTVAAISLSSVALLSNAVLAAVLLIKRRR